MHEVQNVPVIVFTPSILTLLEAEACGPLLQGDIIVAVSVALLEEASGAMLHGNEGSTQGGELCVCQVAVDMKDEVLTENKPNQMDKRTTGRRRNFSEVEFPVQQLVFKPL